MAARAQGLPGPRGSPGGADGEPPGGRILFSLMCELQEGWGGLHWVTRTPSTQCFFLVFTAKKGKEKD